jgi:hypothetical protein
MIVKLSQMRLLLFVFSACLLGACSRLDRTERTIPTAQAVQEPIETTDITASISDFHLYDDPSGIRLYWSAEREPSPTSFTIERSGNGNSWEELGTINGQEAVGNRNNYRFLDETPYSGNNFYRVLLRDSLGNELSSDVQSVLHRGYFNLSMFPNPARLGEQVTLYFEGNENHEFQIELVDQYGNRLYRDSFESDQGTNQLSFIPRAARRGKFFVHVYLDDYPVQSFTLQLN